MTDTTFQYLSFFAVMLLATYLLFAFAKPRERANKPLLEDAPSPKFSHEASQDLSPLLNGPELPFYHDNRLVALAKDPNSIYVYWDLDSKLSEILQQNQPSLRVMSPKDIPSRNSLIGYFHVTGLANNYFLDVPFADTSYFIELGYFDQQGCFVPLLTSNLITTPPMDFSDIDPAWPPIDAVYKHMNFSFRDVGLSSKR